MSTTNQNTQPSACDGQHQIEETDRQKLIRLDTYVTAKSEDLDAAHVVSANRVEQIVQLRHQLDDLLRQQRENELADHNAAIKATKGSPFYSSNLRLGAKLLGEYYAEAIEAIQDALLLIEEILSQKCIIANVYIGPGIEGCKEGEELRSVLLAIHDRFIYKGSAQDGNPVDTLTTYLRARRSGAGEAKARPTPSAPGPLTGDPGTC